MDETKKEKGSNAEQPKKTKGKKITVTQREILALMADDDQVSSLLKELRLGLMLYYRKMLTSGEELTATNLDIIRRLLSSEGITADKLKAERDALAYEAKLEQDMQDIDDELLFDMPDDIIKFN